MQKVNQIDWQKLHEQSIKAIFEARQREIQNSLFPSFSGGSTEEPKLEEKLSIVVFLSSGEVYGQDTWKFEIFDYEKGTKTETIDTEVSSSEWTYASNPPIPIQNKGFVFYFESSDGVFNYTRFFFVNGKGDIVDDFVIKHEFDFAYGTLDGYGFYFQANGEYPFSNPVSKVFNGEEVFDFTLNLPEGYGGVIAFDFSSWSSSTISSGWIPYAEALFPMYEGELPTAPFWVLNSLTGQKVKILNNIFEDGFDFNIYYHHKGNYFSILYFESFGEGEIVTPIRLLYIDMNGNIIQDINVAEYAYNFDNINVSDTVSVNYGDDNSQFTFSYQGATGGTGWLMFGFDGTSKTMDVVDVQPGQFEKLQIWATSYSKGDIQPSRDCNSMLNFFYTPTEGYIGNEVSSATFVYRLKGESSYRTYEFQKPGDPIKAVFTNPNSDFSEAPLGETLVVAVDAGNESGLSYQMSGLILDKTIRFEPLVNILEVENITSDWCYDRLVVFIAYQPYVSEIRAELRLYDNKFNLLDTIYEYNDTIEWTFSGSTIFAQTSTFNYYSNSTINGFAVLDENYDGSYPSEEWNKNYYQTIDNRQDGRLLMVREGFYGDPSVGRVLTKSSLFNEFSFPNVDIKDRIWLGANETFFTETSNYETPNKYYTISDQGLILQNVEDPTSFSFGEDGFFLCEDRFFMLDAESSRFIALGKNTAQVSEQLNIQSSSFTPNDWVWYFNKEQDPTPPPSGYVQINMTSYDIFGDSLITISWSNLDYPQTAYLYVNGSVLIGSINITEPSGSAIALAVDPVNAFVGLDGLTLHIEALSNGNIISSDNWIVNPPSPNPGLKLNNITVGPTCTFWDVTVSGLSTFDCNLTFQYAMPTPFQTWNKAETIIGISNGENQIYEASIPSGNWDTRAFLEIPGAYSPYDEIYANGPIITISA